MIPPASQAQPLGSFELNSLNIFGNWNYFIIIMPFFYNTLLKIYLFICLSFISSNHKVCVEL